MHKYRPELGLYLAEQALKMRYLDTPEQIRERIELKEFCMQTFSSQNAKRFYLRLQKIEINQIIVDTVLNELSAEKRHFIKLKYKNNETFICISMKLNISVAQLNVWNKNILKEINNFMLYTLTAKDVFSKVKILNMIHILDVRIDFFEENFTDNKDEIDFVNKRWLHALTMLRQQYRQLFNILEDFTVRRTESIGNNIIAMKIQYPIDNPSELAHKCHISVAAVSRHLKQFTDSVKKYIS
jgi:hypothetical protein